MYEHRLTDRLCNYWNNLRRDGAIPDFSHFNTATIGDVWQRCVLFTVAPAVAGKPPNVNFYMIGEKLQSFYKSDLVGTLVRPTQRHFQGAQVVSKIEAVISNPEPVIDMGQFVNDKGQTVKYRSCLLPFGRNGVVTHVLAGVSWKEF